MTKTIDRIKLGTTAEHLERVLHHHKDDPAARALLMELGDLILAAKARQISKPLDGVPCERAFAEGVFTELTDPSVDEAYVAFSIELKGGLSDEDRRDLEKLEQLRAQVRR
ncbi:hypothetical protein LU699_12740 [Luteimonas fraxinea]|uniref:Uncharacterized protein n=1 Tax=Luteimonas fraxinea TaxID=2901869 RepID=A0ABS8UHI4_9GAMM|nr:hypothetical protein [Luteimonas fraxinea]MCD9098118.1 hypothetical protein [Luteimonas fraxinea]MCD9125351.1 hypothetical protein [Luteimonas fraxinea]UHH09156.1 hypothetical protein LU699_12740 [Luteimonas fraxinea]